MVNPIKEDFLEILERSKKKKKKSRRKIVSPSKRKRLERKMESMDPCNLDAAGLDIGASEIHVSVPPDRSETPVRVFPTFTCDLNELADWLEECGINTVAMESTGVYWIPIADILESRGIEVYLVNARHIKNVPGRKTDYKDCQWIRRLHTYGLLSASFRPNEVIRALRSLVRHRANLVRYRAMHIQHIHKALLLSPCTPSAGFQLPY